MKTRKYIPIATLDAVRRQTDKAVLASLVSDEGKVYDIWFPKSQISYESLDWLEDLRCGTAGVPSWGLDLKVSRWILERKAEEIGDWLLAKAEQAEQAEQR